MATPEELERKLTDLDFSITDLTGLDYNPVFKEWRKTKNLSVNYIIASKKN